MFLVKIWTCAVRFELYVLRLNYLDLHSKLPIARPKLYNNVTVSTAVRISN